MKVLGHPIHPILVAFPLGLLAAGALFDVLSWLITDPFLPIVAYYMILAGVVGGFTAGLFGLLDWISMGKGTRAKNVGLWHGLGNLAVVLLFLASLLLRSGPAVAPSGIAIASSVAGAALLFVTGWLGGELVYRLGVAVDEGAHANAPSSLTHKTTKKKPTRRI